MIRQEKNGLELIEVFYLYIIIMILLLKFGTLFQKEFGIYGIFLTQIIFILFPVFIIIKIFKLNSDTLFKFKIPNFKTIYNNVSMWVVSLFLIGIISQIQLKLFPNQIKDLELLNTFFKNTKLWQQVLLFSLTPAICEEILFRGLIFESLREKMQPKFAIIFSGILFGIFHIYPGKILTTALLGMLFAYSSYKTKSLVMPIILHFINNSFIFILMPYSNIVKHNNSISISIGLFMFFLIFNGLYQFAKDFSDRK